MGRCPKLCIAMDDVAQRRFEAPSASNTHREKHQAKN